LASALAAADALDLAKKIPAHVNLAAGVDESELQRKEPADSRPVAGAHGLAERRIGRQHRPFVGRNRLGFGLRLGYRESRDQHHGGQRDEPSPMQNPA